MLPWLRKDKGHLISWAILLQLIFYTWCYPSKRAAKFSRVLFNNTFMIPPPPELQTKKGWFSEKVAQCPNCKSV